MSLPQSELGLSDLDVLVSYGVLLSDQGSKTFDNGNSVEGMHTLTTKLNPHLILQSSQVMQDTLMIVAWLSNRAS